MAIPVLPLTLVSSLERRLITSVAEAHSPFTGTSQIQDWGASWWEYQIEMAVTQGAKARQLSAFFAALGGLRGRFLFPDPTIELPVAAGIRHDVQNADRADLERRADRWMRD